MVKRYCDWCGKLMLPHESKRLTTKWNNLCVEVMVAKRDALGVVWNKGDFCHDCIRAAVASTEEADDDK